MWIGKGRVLMGWFLTYNQGGVMRLVMGVCLGLVLVGCSGPKVEIIENMRYLYSHNENALSPSLTLGTIQECVKQEGYHETTRINDKVYHCDGVYVTRAYPYAGQNGYIDIGGAVQAGIYGGLGYAGMKAIGDGIGDSGSTTNVNQEGGGASSNSGALSLSGASASSNSKSSSSNKNINHNTNKNINQTRGYGHR